MDTKEEDSRLAEVSDEVDDEAEIALSRLIDSIGDRMQNNMFPAVQPEEVMGESAQSFATELLQYSIQIEAVELQSYLDQCYKDFRSYVLAYPSKKRPRLQTRSNTNHIITTSSRIWHSNRRQTTSR